MCFSKVLVTFDSGGPKHSLSPEESKFLTMGIVFNNEQYTFYLFVLRNEGEKILKLNAFISYINIKYTERISNLTNERVGQSTFKLTKYSQY